MLVRLLPPLAEPDEDEVLLEVALLLRECVEASVLDRHRGLKRESLRALDLIGRERAQPVALREHGGADRLPIRYQCQREQRTHAEGARITGAHEVAGRRVFDDDRLAAVEDLEEERRFGAFAVLAPPQVFVLGCRSPGPTLAILFIQRDLAHRSLDQALRLLGDEA